METYTIEKSDNLAMMLCELASKIDKDYMGSDAVINGKGALQIDLKIGGNNMQIFIINND